MSPFVVLLSLLLGLLIVLKILSLFRPHRKPNKNALRICFIHPDLGIGGAEKLVVEAAAGLQFRGHHVVMFTSYHDRDPQRSFPATHDGTLKIFVHGNWLPYHAIGRFQLIKALIRFIWVSLAVLWYHLKQPQDIIFVDQISATIPLLKLSGAKVVFYCHFPDLLLTQRKSWIKWFYRLPLDYLEEATTAAAHEILVNSKFTANVFKKTFVHISRNPDVVYPAIEINTELIVDKHFDDRKPFKFVSLNRFERKKNISLALTSFALLKHTPKYLEGLLQLVVAGGYSTLVQENVDHLEELKSQAVKLGISDKVTFKCSITDQERNMLIQECLCLLYTPHNEHFGIVPLEAGLLGTPVIACNSGGPLESVEDGRSGFLREPKPDLWAMCMVELVNDPNKAILMGRHGRDRVKSNFSQQKFISDLEHVFYKLLSIN